MDDLLAQWMTVKTNIAELEKEEKIIRNRVKFVMEKKELMTFQTKSFRISRSNVTRETLSKNVCPPEVWIRYAKKSSFDMIRLMRRDEKEEVHHEEEE